MSKTLGQVAFEALVGPTDTWPNISSSSRADYERVAEAVRDAALAGQPKSAWVERDGVHTLTVLRPVEVARVEHAPLECAITWATSGPEVLSRGTILGDDDRVVALAKHLAEVAAGVRS